jgi:thioredoxin 1
MSDNVSSFTDATWESEVLKSDKPVLVDFWAEWCQPCRVLSPMIETLADEYGDRVKVGKLNVDENTATSAMYQVRGIPTVLFIKGGEVKEQIVGLTSKENLSRLIDKHLD